MPNAVAGADRAKADMVNRERAATKPRMRYRPLRFMIPLTIGPCSAPIARATGVCCPHKCRLTTVQIAFMSRGLLGQVSQCSADSIAKERQSRLWPPSRPQNKSRAQMNRVSGLWLASDQPLSASLASARRSRSRCARNGSVSSAGRASRIESLSPYAERARTAILRRSAIGASRNRSGRSARKAAQRSAPRSRALSSSLSASRAAVRAASSMAGRSCLAGPASRGNFRPGSAVPVRSACPRGTRPRSTAGAFVRTHRS